MRASLLATLAMIGTVVPATAACGSTTNTNDLFANDGDGSVAGDGSGGLNPAGDGGPGGNFDLDAVSNDVAPPCVGLQCQQQACAGGTTTTISGVVYDPAGRDPLYDVGVYVPNAALSPLPTGASCASCDSLYSGSPLVSALTDSAGKFTIKNAPVGSNIPLVVQVGKWRRQITIPTVTACTDNALPDKSVRLPKNRTEGDIPNIAISTGGADSLECLLVRIGLDESEYGPADTKPDARIHIYRGAGGANTSPAAPSSPSALWNNPADLEKYDIVLLSCEGSETTGMNQAALQKYANDGGRVFASHFHYAWFNTGPFGADNLAQWTRGANPLGNINGEILTTLPSGGTFPKGVALHDWLKNVGALNGNLLPMTEAKHNANVTIANTPSTPWIADSASSSITEYFSFNTPVGAAADAQCGRIVYSDLHVGSASKDYTATRVVPTGCNTGALSPQEKALEFMLFDLSSCVVPDTVPPVAPPGAPPQ